MVHTPRFFSSKCILFHNSKVFGSCIIHILYTGCAKIKKKNSGAKRLRNLWFSVYETNIHRFCSCFIYLILHSVAPIVDTTSFNDMEKLVYRIDIPGAFGQEVCSYEQYAESHPETLCLMNRLLLQELRAAPTAMLLGKLTPRPLIFLLQV